MIDPTTTTELFAQLRTQLADAQRPGLAGVRAIEATTQTVDALEDAVKLTEQRGATREAARFGEMLRHLSGRQGRRSQNCGRGCM